jgi:hypothetical protein
VRGNNFVVINKHHRVVFWSERIETAVAGRGDTRTRLNHILNAVGDVASLDDGPRAPFPVIVNNNDAPPWATIAHARQ